MTFFYLQQQFSLKYTSVLKKKVKWFKEKCQVNNSTRVMC